MYQRNTPVSPFSLIADQTNAESIISHYGLDVTQEYLEPVELEKALDFFYQYYLETIQEALESGYDKVVVDKMLAELNSPI